MTIPETNAKRIFSILVVFLFCMAAAQAQVWGKDKMFMTSRSATELNPHLTGFNDTTFWGNFEGVIIYPPGMPSKKYADTNLMKIKDRIGMPEAFIRFSNKGSKLYDYVVTANGTFACADYADSLGLASRLLRRDPVSGNLLPVLGFKINGKFKIIEIAPGKLLLTGSFSEVQGVNGIINARNSVILDVAENIVTAIGNSDNYSSHSMGDDKSFAIVGLGGTLWVAYQGSTKWENAQYASIPAGSQMKAVSWFNLDRAYGAWRVSADATYRLAKMEGGAWSEIGSMHGTQISNYPSYEEMRVTAIQRYGDKLIISHTGTHFNNQPVSPVFAYDIRTGEVQNLPSPLVLNKFGLSYVKVIGDQIYFVALDGFLLLGQQTIWRLQFTQVTAWQYTFTGNGNWSDPQNWAYGFKPPETLPAGKTIFINPSGNGECVLDVTQAIETNASFQVAPGKRFRVTGDLQIGK
jgi:hypothetical protein